MSPSAKSFLLIALFAMGWGTDAHAAKRTVCTITVNSSDEKEMFRQRLPADQYQFVELVERGRPDWLASACRQGVRCDLLVISGHFDGNTEFYSDQVGRERVPAGRGDGARVLQRLLSRSVLAIEGGLSLRVQHVECRRGQEHVLRSRAKPRPRRALARRRASASRATLDQLHGESSRDRMRRIFTNVPVIYGFSSVAPLGPTAATLLGRYLQPSSIAEVGNGRASPEAPRPLCHRVHDRRQRLERFGSARRPSARGLSIHRRPAVAGGQARLHPRPSAPRHGGSPHVPRAHRRPVCVAERSRAASPGFRRGARRDHARSTSRATVTCASPRTPTFPGFAPG